MAYAIISELLPANAFGKYFPRVFYVQKGFDPQAVGFELVVRTVDSLMAENVRKSSTGKTFSTNLLLLVSYKTNCSL